MVSENVVNFVNHCYKRKFIISISKRQQTGFVFLHSCSSTKSHQDSASRLCRAESIEIYSFNIVIKWTCADLFRKTAYRSQNSYSKIRVCISEVSSPLWCIYLTKMVKIRVILREIQNKRTYKRNFVFVLTEIYLKIRLYFNNFEYNRLYVCKNILIQSIEKLNIKITYRGNE